MNQTKRKKDVRTIVLTGGHAATNALAIVEELIERDQGWDIYWIGSKDLIKNTVDSRKIIAGKLHKRWSIHAVTSLVKIPFGFFGAFYHLTKIRPRVILSFGGFAALPVVVVGWLLGIPSILHEQTVVAGLANKLSSSFVKRITIAREQSKGYYSAGKVILVGNPQVKEMFTVEKKIKIGKPPTVYITGGSSGSQILNRVVKSILVELLEKYIVIHQTGDLDFGEFEKIKNTRYEAFAFIDPEDVANVFRRADIVVSRGGANTVADIMNTHRPAIIIPIPWSIGDEQTNNAKMAESAGIAEILPQEKLSGRNLYGLIRKVEKNWGNMVNSDSSSKKLDINAASKLVDLVESVIK